MEIITGTATEVVSMLSDAWRALAAVWFLILPGVFYFLFRILWLAFVQDRFNSTLKFVVLELIPPKDIESSPKPLESLFLGVAGILTTYNVIEEFIKGAFLPPFSFELVSTEGRIHLYVRAPRQFRTLIEAHLYAQYPNVEIQEVPDYVGQFPRILPNRDWDLWGSDMELTDPDPIPIKTYRKFEEDITGKMIDPLANLIETASVLPPGQHIWLQYVIVPIKEGWKKEQTIVAELAGRLESKPGAFEAVLKDFGDVFSNLWNALWGPVEFAKTEKKEQQPLEFRLTPGERDKLKAVEENIGKNQFKTKMRFIYLGRRNGFDKSFVSSFMGGIKQFNDQNLNGFKPNDDSKTYANFIFVQSRLRYRQRKIYRRYRDRDMDGKTFVMSTEEMATVFHLPDMSVMTPTLPRVEAKRGGAPANLPVG